jgi:DNA-binding CsgD family transcriptional regulator
MRTWQERRSQFGEAYADTWDKVVMAQIAEARNGPPAAVSLLARVYAELPTHRFLLMCDPTCAAWLVRTALSADDPERAKTAAVAADEIALASPEIEVAAISAAHASGLADQDPARLEQAVTGHADPWARASAGEDLAELLVAAGRRRDAVTRLGQAIEGYEATGAARDTARVRRRLRRLGVRRQHWAVETRPTTGWLSLTGTECAVSKLVAEGLTNQQVADQMFISVHTVAFHLRQVFRKLGISSRVELARAAVAGLHSLMRGRAPRAGRPPRKERLWRALSGPAHRRHPARPNAAGSDAARPRQEPRQRHAPRADVGQSECGLSRRGQ